ncbi:DYW domain-containing protein [Plasmodiophora brassicae]
MRSAVRRALDRHVARRVRYATQAGLDAMFGQGPSVPKVVRDLKRERDPDRGWTMFQDVVRSGTPADVRLFQVMLSFCKRRLPAKAPDVLDAALSRGIPVCEGLFCTFLGSCQSATPPLTRPAFDMYQRCAPRTHNVILGMVDLARLAHAPQAALPLIADAVTHNVEFTDRLLTVFAVCCAESRSANAAAHLLALIRSGRVPSHPVPQAYGNLIKAFLAQNRIDDAVDVVDLVDGTMPPSVHIYTHVLSALAKADRVQQAISMFRRMIERNVAPGVPVITLLIGACARADDLPSIRVLHDYATRSAIVGDVVIACSLVSAFERCGDLPSAERVFAGVDTPDAPLVNVMVAGYARHGLLDKAIGLFDNANVTPSDRLYTTILSVLAKANAVPRAVHLFNDMVSRGVSVHPSVLVHLLTASARCQDLPAVKNLHKYANNNAVASALISAYDQCGDLAAAETVFQSMTKPPASAFVAMIAAYGYRWRVADALTVVGNLRQASLDLDPAVLSDLVAALAKIDEVPTAMSFFTDAVERDAAVFTSLVAACGRSSEIATLQRLSQNELLLQDDTIARAFVSAYAHCWRLDAAEQLFERRIATAGITLVNAMIAAYSRYGALDLALATYERMKASGTWRPDAGTLTALLSGCRDPERAKDLVAEFGDVWRVAMNGDHIACLAAVHGRVGDLDEAERLAPSSMALLRACRAHRDVARAERVFAMISASNAPVALISNAYLLMADIHAAAGQYEDMARVRNTVKGRGVSKMPCRTSLQLSDRPHHFFSDDERCQYDPGLVEQHDVVMQALLDDGYTPASSDFARPAVYRHSVKLAVSYALTTLRPGAPVRITVNQSLCSDCHDAVRRVSYIFKRDVFVRDADCHHHFQDGRCSCGGFW